MATTQTQPAPTFNPFGAVAADSKKTVEEQFDAAESSIYLSKKHVYDLRVEVIAFKMFFSTDPRRTLNIPGFPPMPGVNVAFEARVLSGESTDPNVRPGKVVNLFWTLDAGKPADQKKFDEMEIAECAGAFEGRKPSEVYADLMAKGMSFFEDESKYAGNIARVYSKAAKKKKDGTISDLRNIGVELIEAAAPTLVEETAPAAPAPINTPVRRGTKSTTPAEAMPS